MVSPANSVSTTGIRGKTYTLLEPFVNKNNAALFDEVDTPDNSPETAKRDYRDKLILCFEFCKDFH